MYTMNPQDRTSEQHFPILYDHQILFILDHLSEAVFCRTYLKGKKKNSDYMFFLDSYYLLEYKIIRHIY